MRVEEQEWTEHDWLGRAGLILTSFHLIRGRGSGTVNTTGSGAERTWKLVVSSFGIMELLLCLLIKSRLFLLCLRVGCLVSNLVKVLTILEMKALSFLFCMVSTSALILSSILRDIRAGIVLDNRAGAWPELGNALDTGVEALIDAVKDIEASEVTSSEAQKVQFEIAK